MVFWVFSFLFSFHSFHFSTFLFVLGRSVGRSVGRAGHLVCLVFLFSPYYRVGMTI